jgi:patatin-like phospholipase/acyl hydrolase
MARLLRILSLDGGGIRGIIPGEILVHLEEIFQKSTGNAEARIADFFDLVAGTSTGGILTCLYLCPGETKVTGLVRPRFSAQDIVNFYVQDGPLIFQKNLQQNLFSGYGLWGQKYSDKNLLSCLEQRFGNLKLSDLLKPCLITAYDIEARAAYFFTQHNAVKNPEYNYWVKDVARATSAAPTYFKPAKIASLANKEVALIDGGVIANNPALCALAEAKQELKSPFKDLLILSLGTGDDQKPISYQQSKNWGDIDWAVPIINILMSGNDETVDYQLKTIFSSMQKEDQYLRINPKLTDSMAAMDNGTPKNIKDLVDYGDQTAQLFHDQLKKIAQLLMNNEPL